MSNDGSSVIGTLQQEAQETAKNLDKTAGGLRTFEKPLQSALVHTRKAMGHTHQSDVPEMTRIVEEAIKVILDCAAEVEEGAQQIRNIEKRT